MRTRIIEWLKEHKTDSQTGQYGRALIIGLPGGITYLNNSDSTTDHAVSYFAEEIENLVYELIGRMHMTKEKR